MSNIRVVDWNLVRSPNRWPDQRENKNKQKHCVVLGKDERGRYMREEKLFKKRCLLLKLWKTTVKSHSGSILYS